MSQDTNGMQIIALSDIPPVTGNLGFPVDMIGNEPIPNTGVRVNGLCAYDFTKPDEQEMLRLHLEYLLDRAKVAGVVLEIETIPLKPLASGHFEQRAVARKARGHY